MSPARGQEMGPVIVARGLRRSYEEAGRRFEVLRGVELRLEAGEHIALVGRSGSGKTTLLNLLGALDRGYGGSLEIMGRELRSLSERDLAELRNRTTGYVYQSFHLLPHLSVRENVELPAYFGSQGLPPRAELRQRSERCLDQVGLGQLGGRRPLHLSGGERQRVAIARALFQEPRIILCDEPTGSLDEDTGAEILRLFEELRQQLRVTLVVVTHDPKVASAADRVLRLSNGSLQEESRRAGDDQAPERGGSGPESEKAP